jgi:hypothetical protein
LLFLRGLAGYGGREQMLGRCLESVKTEDMGRGDEKQHQDHHLTTIHSIAPYVLHPQQQHLHDSMEPASPDPPQTAVTPSRYRKISRHKIQKSEKEKI